MWNNTIKAEQGAQTTPLPPAKVIALNARVTYCPRMKFSKECLISVEMQAFYFDTIIHHWSYTKEHAKQNVPVHYLVYYCLQLCYRCGENFPGQWKLAAMPVR